MASEYVGQVRVRGGQVPYLLVAFSDMIFVVPGNPTAAIAGLVTKITGPERIPESTKESGADTVRGFLSGTEFGRAEKKTADLRTGVASAEFDAKVKAAFRIAPDSVTRAGITLVGGRPLLDFKTENRHIATLGSRGIGFYFERGDFETVSLIMQSVLGPRFTGYVKPKSIASYISGLLK